MTTPCPRRPLALALVAVLALAPRATRAADAPPDDSTRTESWTLANGLQVTARHVPGAMGIAAVLAFRAGSGFDPVDRPELARLLAEVEFTGATGDVPERTRDEMPELRPLGWGFETNWRHTLLTEVATRDQFPSVLSQMASRLAGVSVTDPLVRAALATVRRDLGTQFAGRPQFALATRVGSLARGLTDERVVSAASCRSLERLTARDVAKALETRYVPANAVLSLAGDFGEIDLQALVERSFGGIAGGTPQREAPDPTLKPGERAAPWTGIDGPVGVVAAFAPAITDSVHPAYYIGATIFGAGLTETWGRTGILPSRYQYSLYSDPDIVRFYPQVGASAASPAALVTELSNQMDVLTSQVLPPEMFDQARRNLAWLIGGPLPRDVRVRASQEAGPLATIARNAASRALWKGESFWSEYRRRFDHVWLGPTLIAPLLVDPKRQAVLLFTPRH